MQIEIKIANKFSSLKMCFLIYKNKCWKTNKQIKKCLS